MVWVGHVRSDKFRRDIVTRTFALIAPDWPICTEFSAVIKRSQMHPNFTKCKKYEIRVQWCGSGAFIMKSSAQLRGMNFCINCTSSAHLAPSLVQYRNYPKCTQTLRNTLKHEFRVQLCG